MIRACDTALSKGRKSAVIYEFRGLALSRTEDYPGAIRDFGLALELRPHDATLLKQRGWAYLSADAAKLALADFDAAIKLKPDDADAFTGRGSAHARLGDHRAAVADAREAIRVGKTDPRVTYNAARIYAIAASVAASEVGEKGRAAGVTRVPIPGCRRTIDSRSASSKSRPRTRPAFWRETIQLDPAMKVIKRRLNYDELIASNKKTRRIGGPVIRAEPTTRCCQYVPHQVPPNGPEAP